MIGIRRKRLCVRSCSILLIRRIMGRRISARCTCRCSRSINRRSRCSRSTCRCSRSRIRCSRCSSRCIRRCCRCSSRCIRRRCSLLLRKNEPREHPEIRCAGKDHYTACDSGYDRDQIERVTDHEKSGCDLEGSHKKRDPPFPVFLPVEKKCLTDVDESAQYSQYPHDRGDQLDKFVRMENDHDPADQHDRCHHKQQRPGHRLMVFPEQESGYDPADCKYRADASAYDHKACARPDQKNDTDDQSTDREDQTVRLKAAHYCYPLSDEQMRASCRSHFVLDHPPHTFSNGCKSSVLNYQCKFSVLNYHAVNPLYPHFPRYGIYFLKSVSPKSAPFPAFRICSAGSSFPRYSSITL